ncbi:MAG: SMC-Scp complex subunit ScpB [Candidatus Aenigmatarchaeota archaeon]
MDELNNNQEKKLDKLTIKSIIESLLFINENPISLEELKEVLEIEKKEIEIVSGICIVKVAGGYQMCASPLNEPWIKKLYQGRSRQKLSQAALETLAIVAYRQPITRIEIESIRGVNSEGVIKHLLELGLVKVGGRKEVIGRPFFYITTRKFLEYFGLNSLKDLPNLEEFSSFATKVEEKVQKDSSIEVELKEDKLSFTKMEEEK